MDLFAAKSGYIALTPSKTVYRDEHAPVVMDDTPHTASLLDAGVVLKSLGGAPENKMLKGHIQNKVVDVDENKDDGVNQDVVNLVDMDNEVFKAHYKKIVGNNLHHLKSRANAIKEIEGAA